MTNNEHSVRLRVGGECTTGQIVASILGQSTKVTVFTTTDNHLRWRYHENHGDLPDDYIAIVSDFDSLMTEIRTYVPEHNRPEAYMLLGKALFGAINSTVLKSSAHYFDHVRHFISQLSTQRARFIYIMCALGVAVCAIAILLGVGYFWFSKSVVYFYGAVFGGAGAAVSVMQRSKDLELDNRLPTPSICMQASIRILLGSVFGVIFIFASKANLLMGTISTDLHSLCVFSLVSGFSERFIPDLIDRLESRSKEE